MATILHRQPEALDIAFGDGLGNDNIIQCSKHINGPTEPCSILLNVEMLLEPETKSILVIAPNTDQEVVRCVLKAKYLLMIACETIVDNHDSETTAIENLSKIAQITKTLVARKKDMLEPLKAEIDTINTAFKTIMEPVTEADKILRGKWLSYKALQQHKKEEADRVARMEREAVEARAALEGKQSPLLPVVQQPEVKTHVKTDAGSASMKMNTLHEVVDFAALSDRYKMVDAGKLTREVKAGGPNQVIAGVRIWQEPILQMNTR